MKEFEGKLLSFDNRELVIEAGKKQHTISYEKVASARLPFVLKCLVHLINEKDTSHDNGKVLTSFEPFAVLRMGCHV